MSDKYEVIEILRVILIILVVTLHAYTATRTVEWLHDGYPIYAFFTHNFSLLAGYIAVPFFYFISGYLFFQSSSKNVHYIKKWRNRVHSLLIPYVIWNFLILILLYFLQITFEGKDYFSGNHKFVMDYTCLDFLRAFWDSGDWNRGDGTPVLSVLWYIRNLMILTLLTPIIWYFNKWIKFFWLMPVFIIWIFTPRLAFMTCSIFWFGLGTYFSCAKIDLNLFFYKKRILVTVLFVLFFVIYNLLFFYNPMNFVFKVFIHRMCIVFAIPLLYIIVMIGINRWKWKIPYHFTQAVCFIFVFHYYLIIGIRKLMIKFLPDVGDVGMLLLYFSSIVITIFISFYTYVILQKLMPRILNFITGGRG